MAAGDITLIQGPEIIGPALKISTFKVEMPDAYVQGGHALDLTAYSDEEILNVIVGADSAANGIVCQYVNDDMTDLDGGAIVAFWADYDAVADGALVEVDADEDLSTTVLRVTVFAK